MVIAATACWTLLLVTSGTDTTTVKSFLSVIIVLLPKLGDCFFQTDIINALRPESYGKR